MVCCSTRFRIATATRHRRRSCGFHGTYMVQRQPCRGIPVLLASFSLQGLERQLSPAAGDGPDGLRYKGHGHGEHRARPDGAPHVLENGAEGIQWGAGGRQCFIDNDADGSARGEADEQQYVHVHLPVRRGTGGRSGRAGVYGIVRLVFRNSGFDLIQGSLPARVPRSALGLP